MSVLSDADIRKITANHKGIIISNLRQENITAVGYDLTIGFICDSDTGEVPEKLPENRRYCLLPGHRYLVISREYIYLSPKYMATLHSRGSYALKGILVSSTTIDPNRKGCVYASLFNCSDNPIYIKEDNAFATMVIHKFVTPTKKKLPKNDNGKPKDTRDTLNSPFSNICAQAVTNAKAYTAEIRDETDGEFFEQYDSTIKGGTVINFLKKHRETFAKYRKRLALLLILLLFAAALAVINKKYKINIDPGLFISLFQ